MLITNDFPLSGLQSVYVSQYENAHSLLEKAFENIEVSGENGL